MKMSACYAHFRWAVKEQDNSAKSPEIHTQKLIFWDGNMPFLMFHYSL
jgi:hypothetical protein